MVKRQIPGWFKYGSLEGDFGYGGLIHNYSNHDLISSVRRVGINGSNSY